MLLSTNSAISAIHRGASFNDIELINNDDAALFNYYSDLFCDDVVIKTNTIIDHETRQQQWTYPSEYDNINLEEYFIGLCTTDIEKERVQYELQLFTERNLNKLLRWAIWFMDYVKLNNEFVGVGRGSSVASYCLYLIDLHLIDSIKYKLDPREFLK